MVTSGVTVANAATVTVSTLSSGVPLTVLNAGARDGRMSMYEPNSWLELVLWILVFMSPGPMMIFGWDVLPRLIERSGPPVVREWREHPYTYQEGVDGRVRRQYSDWGEIDYWSRWRKPEEFDHPEFPGYPCNR